MLRGRPNVSDVAVVERVKCSAREDSGAWLDEFPYRRKCLDDHLRSPPRTDGRRRLSVVGPNPPTSFIPTFRHIHPPAGPLLGCNVALTYQIPVSPDFQHQVPLPDRGIDSTGARTAPSRRLADRRIGGMDVAIQASRAERQDRGLRG